MRRDAAEALSEIKEKLRLDALDSVKSEQEEVKAPTAAAAAAFLQRVRRAELTTFPAIGEGEDVRLSARNLTGAVLAKQERVIHIGVFRLAS